MAYVVSKSMESKIRNSDYLFIKNTPQIDYNTIGIFQVDGTNYVKKLRQGCLKKTQSRIPRHPPRRKQPYSYHRESCQAI
ncbi:S24 family peptidase [Streptococcus pneumoniae]|nr:S24 family peptidase [Streptococcus pneumoniae]MDG9382385.1 S24 family peptidase [Streptococcus pneumoniae]MDG9428051.1 S24 family peptidase [Streptococcus pneumoniae]MDG9461653.1 S24 family peptidase [Streptococcus pneumoniae]